MGLIKTRTFAKYQASDEANNHPHYPSHKDEPADFYHKYKDDSFAPVKGSRNPQNLFDDSDTKDKYWFNIAIESLKLNRP